MKRRAQGLRRAVSIAGATLMLLGIPGGMTARGADPALFGFGMHANATAISTIYDQPTFGVPTDPTFELRKFHSVADLDSGPSGHGLGSILWPGDVIGNAPPSLALDTLLFNPTRLPQMNDVIQRIKDGAAPFTEGASGYPVRAEAFYPPTSSNPRDDERTLVERDFAGGARMAASAKEDVVMGSSTAGGGGVCGIICYGSLFARSTSKVVNDQAIAESVARITDLDFLGFVRFDSLVATAQAVSDGVTAKVSSTMQITGLTILRGPGGEEAAKITVDKDGFHAPNRDEDPFGVLADQVIKKYLEPQGIDLSIGTPADVVGGASARRDVTGLTFHLDARGMNVLLSRFPADIRNTLKSPTSNDAIAPIFTGPLPGLPNGLLSPTVAGFVATFFQGDQDMNFVFGSVGVNSASSPPLPEFPAPAIPPFTPPLTPPFDPGGFTPGDGFAPPATGPGTTVGGLPLKPVAVVGIPFGFLALLIAIGLFGSRRLRLFADRVVSAQAAVRCPLEDG